jgi:hypothetical protein
VLYNTTTNYTTLYNIITDMDTLKLRDRTIFLVALIGFARPSDLGFKTWFREQIRFESHHSDTGNEKRFMTFTLLGTKADYKRNGSQVRIYESENIESCPVRHLQQYLKRTGKYTSDVTILDRFGKPKTPVFLSIPLRGNKIIPLSNGSIARVMTSMLRTLGINNKVITAKSFRPTAATSAHLNGVSLDEILDLGRWSHMSAPIILTHYIRRSEMHNVTDKLMGSYSPRVPSTEQFHSDEDSSLEDSN